MQRPHNWQLAEDAGGTLYIGTFGGDLWAIPDTGKKEGAQATVCQDRICSTPWIENGIVHLTTNDGHVYAVTGGKPSQS
jgi:outer membrane protein assembly factor BamB